MRGLALAVSFALTGGALLAAPQQTQTPQPPSFRAGIDLVQLDVSVLDKNRQPVRGLKKEDFTILENGAPRAVEAFAAIDLPDVESNATTATWQRDITPDVTTNAIPSTGRVFVIVIDDALMPTDIGAVDLARKGASSVVARMGPDDLAAVVFTKFGHGAQGLTSDRTKLMAAIHAISPMGNTPLGATPQYAPPPPGARPNRNRILTAPSCGDYLSSVRVVEDAANYLAALAGRRKAVLYFSGGISMDLGAQVVTGPILPLRPDEPQACGAEVADAVQQAFVNAERANVAIYGIDIMGLRVDGYLGSPSGNVVSFLQVVSDNTGGHAIVNTNDLGPGIQQIFRENSSYYLVGYKPADMKADGSIKRLEVKVNRPDVEVVSRRLYYAPKPAKANATPPPANVTALSEIIPKSDWPMRIAAMPVKAGVNGVAAIALGLERPAPHDRVTDSLELTIKAFTPEGDARGSFDETVPVTLPPSAQGATKTEYDVLASLPLPPGRYQLRVSAHSKTLDTRGSVYADVEVPDFAKSPLAFSGVLVTVAPGLTAAPRLVLSPIVPVVPTSLRTFATTDHVSAFLRVYESKEMQPVIVNVRITDEHDQVVITQHASYAADAFKATGSVDLAYALPMGRLSPGDYLLTFEGVIAKTSARRDVRFSVKER